MPRFPRIDHEYVERVARDDEAFNLDPVASHLYPTARPSDGLLYPYTDPGSVWTMSSADTPGMTEASTPAPIDETEYPLYAHLDLKVCHGPHGYKYEPSVKNMLASVWRHSKVAVSIIAPSPELATPGWWKAGVFSYENTGEVTVQFKKDWNTCLATLEGQSCKAFACVNYSNATFGDRADPLVKELNDFTLKYAEGGTSPGDETLEPQAPDISWKELLDGAFGTGPEALHRRKQQLIYSGWCPSTVPGVRSQEVWAQGSAVSLSQVRFIGSCTFVDDTRGPLEGRMDVSITPICILPVGTHPTYFHSPNLCVNMPAP